MGNDNKLKNVDIVDALLNIKVSKLKDKGKALKNNVKHIAKLLDDLDEDKEYNKYLSLSCIYGAFLGDSMGSACEFLEESPNNHELIFEPKLKQVFKPGEITDDSEMALSAAFAYIDILKEEDSSKSKDYLYFYFCLWKNSSPKDIGNTTEIALKNWKGENINETKFDFEEVKRVNWGSLANGALMRISTFIVYYYYKKFDKLHLIISKYFSKDNNQANQVNLNPDLFNLYLDIYNEVFNNVQITHPNYENGISCAVFTLMTLIGMVTKDAKKIYAFFKEISESPQFIDMHDKILFNYAKETQKKYKQIISEIETNKPISVYNHMGYYIHAFKLSVYFLYKYPDMGENKDNDLYYKIMCDICDKGGDTDTNCAIVGTLIGPLIGYKNFNTKNKNLFKTFIEFIPPKRTQFTSAFIYEYVNYLEKNTLNKDKNKDKDKNETNKSNKGFQYTALQMIQKFLNEDIYGKKNKNK